MALQDTKHKVQNNGVYENNEEVEMNMNKELEYEKESKRHSECMQVALGVMTVIILVLVGAVIAFAVMWKKGKNQSTW